MSESTSEELLEALEKITKLAAKYSDVRGFKR